MTARPKVLLFAALATLALPGLGAEVIETTTTRYHVPGTPYVPSTTYYYTTEPTYYYRPTVTEVYEAPPIVVEAPRIAEDERITDDVVHVLAHDPRLSGRIGVETRDNEVTLSGTVTTPGQARIAARDAKSVWGVRNVQNELRPRVGANTY